jgi:hypothetical protein
MDPDSSTTRSLRNRSLLFLVFTLLAYFFMRWVSHGLTGKDIVAFEMAKTVEQARSLLLAWGDAVRADLLRSIYADYVFLVAYAGWLFYFCRYAGRLSGNYILRNAARFFSWLGPLSALFDVIENAGMLYSLNVGIHPWAVHLTYDMAVGKFSLIFIVLLFAGTGLLYAGIESISRKRAGG